jgi:hypothetical protein
MLIGLVTTCTLLREEQKQEYEWWEDKEEDVGRYVIIVRKRECTGNWKGKTLDRTLWRTRQIRDYGPVIRQTAKWTIFVFLTRTTRPILYFRGATVTCGSLRSSALLQAVLCRLASASACN